MTGAKSAYEMIVTAYAEGDRKTLKNLLSRDVYDSFASAMTEREQRGESVEFKFVGISKAEITDAEVQNKVINVTVKFTSDIITATLDRSAEVIEGSPSQIREVIDYWTFSRDVSSRDPNWKLVATGAES
jgi:predicted lipid-binding transport protein (Tim44 family)